MPYVNKSQRAGLDDGRLPNNPGELNYRITKLVDGYVEEFGVCYDILNEVMGALECAKQEFYRRVVAPYEDQKMAQTGDVYDSIRR